MLENSRILLTGPTSQVGWPIARALAAQNEVVGLARFRKPEERQRMEAAGVRCIALDLAQDPLDALPRDFDYVLHFAVAKTGDFDARPRRQRRRHRPPLRALPRREGGAALLVRRRVRAAGTQAREGDRSARRQPPRGDADLQPVQDRRGGGRAHRGAPLRPARHDRALQRARTATTAAGPSTT